MADSNDKKSLKSELRDLINSGDMLAILKRLFSRRFPAFLKIPVEEVDADVIDLGHYLHFCLGLCKKRSVHHYMCIIFSLVQPIAMFSFNHCVMCQSIYTVNFAPPPHPHTSGISFFKGRVEKFLVGCKWHH